MRDLEEKAWGEGFLSIDIAGLPPQLKDEIDRAVEQSDKDMM